MPVTDILNPTTVITNNAAVSSANALAVKVISGGGSGITVDTTTITGGTTTRLLYDNGGTVGETAAVTYASASVTMAFSSLGILGFKSSASVVDVGLSRSAASVVAIGNGTAGDTTGTLRVGTVVGGQGSSITPAVAFSADVRDGFYQPAAGAIALTLTSAPRFYWDNQNHYAGRSNAIFSWDTGAVDLVSDTGLSRVSPSVVAIGNGSAGDFSGTLKVGSLTYGSAAVAFANTATGSGSLVGATNPTVSSLIATGTLTYGGVTLASTVTGTGSMVLATNPTISSAVFASTATTTFTAGGTITYGGVTLSSTATGTGSLVLSASPSITGTATFAALTATGITTLSSAVTISAGSALTYGGVTLATITTGTGNLVLSASPTHTGTANFAALSASGVGTFQNGVAASASVATVGIQISSTASFGIMWAANGSVVPTLAATQGCLFINSTGSSTAARMFIRGSAAWIAVTTAS